MPYGKLLCLRCRYLWGEDVRSFLHCPFAMCHADYDAANPIESGSWKGGEAEEEEAEEEEKKKPEPALAIWTPRGDCNYDKGNKVGLCSHHMWRAKNAGQSRYFKDMYCRRQFAGGQIAGIKKAA